MNAPADIRQPPNSLELEQALLGALILSNDVMHRISDAVRAEHFFEPLHQQIFEVSDRIISEGRTATPATIAPYLGEVDLGGVTVSQYLARLCAEAITISGAPGYAQEIYELAMRRRLIEVAVDYIDKSYHAAAGVKPAKIAAEMVSDLDEIASAGISPTMRGATIGQAGRSAYAACVAIRDGAPTRGLRTGLKSLDDMIGCLERGAGSVLAGRPSMGKSAVALEIAHNVARFGKGVAYFSLEMGAEALAQRALSSIAYDDGEMPPIPYFRIQSGKVSARETQRLERATGLLDDLPVFVDPQPALSVSQIGSRARRLIIREKERGGDVALIVVDHLGLIAASGRYAGDRVREIGEISSSLHALARETDTHVMMLSQLSRKCEDRQDKRPMLSDIRESGEIEQNADIVFGVFREAYYLERGGNLSIEQIDALERCRNTLEIGILKQRQGATGSVMLFADLACNAIRGLA